MKKIISLFVIVLLANYTFANNNAKKVASSESEGMLYSILWQQHASEFRALCYQAYNIAQLRLDNILQDPPKGKLAIVVDADETIIDNAPYEAMLLKENKHYPYRRDEWVNAAICTAIPGSLEYLNYAVKKGVDIFYISNRRDYQLEGTMKNLEKLGFPQIEKSHFLFKTSGVSKEDRRNMVKKTHTIVQLIGDNLNDFEIAFKRKSIQQRFQLTDQFRAKFGNEFIVLPNAMYGEWQKAIYGNKRIPNEEKIKAYRNGMNCFE